MPLRRFGSYWAGSRCLASAWDSSCWVWRWVEIFKLKFGHRGANQPVLNRDTGKVEITTQNHGFAVGADSLPGDSEVTHINLNDQTVEGIRNQRLRAFGVQYHPEASAGPHDSHYLFGVFRDMMSAHPV